MDASDPPRIVFESTTTCADGDDAEGLLRRALAASRAPGPGWVVTMRVESGLGQPDAGLSAQGDIADGTGAARAHTLVTAGGPDCAGMARDIGAWASMVLRQTVDETAAPAENPGPPPLPPPAVDGDVSSAAVPPTAPPAAPPTIRRSTVEATAPPADEEEPPRELGVGTFFITGAGSGGYAGLSPFFVDRVGTNLFLRPSIALGQSLASEGRSIFAAARLDTCLRLSGAYPTGSGVQLDVCGGADVGLSYLPADVVAGESSNAQTLPYVNVGPSLELRSEVGRLAVTLRAVGGVNVFAQGFRDSTGARADSVPWSTRVELDFGWGLR